MKHFYPRPKATTPTHRLQVVRGAYRDLLAPVLVCVVLYVIVSLVQGTFALGTVVP